MYTHVRPDPPSAPPCSDRGPVARLLQAPQLQDPHELLQPARQYPPAAMFKAAASYAFAPSHGMSAVRLEAIGWLPCSVQLCS